MKNLKDRVTIYEVAKQSNVSLATVSRVINNQNNVSEKTKKIVNETIARLGYKPSALAQALATNRTTNIGVIIPNANYVYISNLLYGLTEIARANNFIISLFVTAHNKAEASNVVEKVITSHVDGAIVFDDELDVEDISKITSYNVPSIIINYNLVKDRIGCVYFGYEHLLKKIVAGVLTRENNKKDIIFLNIKDGGRLLSRMEKAFYEIHEILNKKGETILIYDSYTKTYDFFNEYFKEHKEKKYIITYRDSIACAVINAAKNNNLNIPNDIEVLSIIGTKYANIVNPSISSMQIDMIDVGKKAMNMLKELIDHKLEDKAYKFESIYIKRDSTLD